MQKYKRHLVAGGAGFLGSHLIDQLIKDDNEVVCVDNLYTGLKSNIEHLLQNNKFKFIEHDIINYINCEADYIWNLACPASPIHYQSDPIKTSLVNFLGTYNLLKLATEKNARYLQASTSEVYGDPEISPQSEDYKGNVNITGIRGCYDEGKRIAETLCFDFKRKHQTNICVARIFNTYGPRMRSDDGRVVSNFIMQSLLELPITIYGNGFQTRSFCYVDDLINGLIKLMFSNESGPINLGNPTEFTIHDLAKYIKSKINNKKSLIVFKDLPQDDPTQRKPDISLAKKILNWQPEVNLDQGLEQTIDWFKSIISEDNYKIA